jgi:hypothetical protein
MSAPQNVIGIVYDYDQTLSPTYMQDEVMFPHFGINPGSFWKKCQSLVAEEGYDSELAYLKALLEYLNFDRPTHSQMLALGAKLNFFPGLPEMFDEIDSVLTPAHKAMDVRIEHYIVSSGIKVLIDGSRLAKYMTSIFGCEFATDEEDRIAFPKRVISHTQKTQYLFRINKGLLEPSQDVNDHMPAHLRRIPFKNMIYLGDGPTDVPCFTVVRQYGGQAIAVYNPHDPSRASFRKCFQLSAHADRVKHIAPGDYRPGSHLRLLLEQMVTDIADHMLAERKAEMAAEIVGAPKHS